MRVCECSRGHQRINHAQNWPATRYRPLLYKNSDYGLATILTIIYFDRLWSAMVGFYIGIALSVKFVAAVLFSRTSLLCLGG